MVGYRVLEAGQGASDEHSNRGFAGKFGPKSPIGSLVVNTNPSTSAAVLTPAAVAPALLERHKAALRSYVEALTKGDAAKVEAVVEAVWLEAQATENGEFEEDPTVWLFSNARRRVIGSGPRDALAGEAGGGTGG